MTAGASARPNVQRSLRLDSCKRISPLSSDLQCKIQEGSPPPSHFVSNPVFCSAGFFFFSPFFDSFEIHPRFIRKAFRFRQVSHEKENNPANRMTAFFSLFGFSTFSYSSRVQASLRFSESSAASGICSHLASSISVLIHLNGIDQTSLPLFRVISCFSAAF